MKKLTRLIIPTLIALLVSGPALAGKWVITGDDKQISVGCSASYVSDNDIHVSLHGVRRRQLLRYDGTNGTYLPDKYNVIFRKDGWDARGLFPVKTPNGTLVASGNLTYGYIEMPLETSGYIGFVNSTGYFKLSPGKFWY
jgi:hypothetical protein